jgi:hypothetical protein
MVHITIQAYLNVKAGHQVRCPVDASSGELRQDRFLEASVRPCVRAPTLYLLLGSRLHMLNVKLLSITAKRLAIHM